MLPTNLEKQWIHESCFILYVFLKDYFRKPISTKEQLLVHKSTPKEKTWVYEKGKERGQGKVAGTGGPPVSDSWGTNPTLGGPLALANAREQQLCTGPAQNQGLLPLAPKINQEEACFQQ